MFNILKILKNNRSNINTYNNMLLNGINTSNIIMNKNIKNKRFFSTKINKLCIDNINNRNTEYNLFLNSKYNFKYLIVRYPSFSKSIFENEGSFNLNFSMDKMDDFNFYS